MTGSKTFDVVTRFGTEKNCSLSVGRYADNDHIAIQIWCADGPYATLTVNLPETKKHPKNFAYVDVNNFPQAIELIKRLKIGKLVKQFGYSGFCAYPLFAFDEDKVHDYSAR